MWEFWGSLLFLCFAAFWGGVVNAWAGGGTLLTFPALLLVLGTSPESTVLANITSKVALFPGAWSAAWGYRGELNVSRKRLICLILPSLIGGIAGSGLLLVLPNQTFKVAVPWLILTAALLFGLQPLIAKWSGVTEPAEQQREGSLALAVALQFLIAVYGGYFGAGIGILMLTAFAFSGLTNIHEMNALKSVLGTCINGISVGVFIFTGTVHWTFAATMAVAAILGGYVAARVARRLNRQFLRVVVTLLGLVLAGYYFWQVFFRN